MEKDDEIKGSGNSYDFGARIYDPRVGRWLACDPLAAKYPNLSPYNFVGNSPILFIDPNGKEIIINYKNALGEYDSFKYTPLCKSVDNIYVMKAVEALDKIYAVKTGKYNSPDKILSLLVSSNTKIVNIYEDFPSLSNTQTEGDSHQAGISWNATIGAVLLDNDKVPTGLKQSPFVILGHELGHAYNLFDETLDGRKKIDVPNYDNYEEQYVINGIETIIANFYSEGTRTNYFGEEYVVNPGISTCSDMPEMSANPSDDAKNTDGKQIEL